MLIRVRCSICQLSFSTVRALLDHRAGHELATGDDSGPAALPPSRADTTPRAMASQPKGQGDGPGIDRATQTSPVGDAGWWLDPIYPDCLESVRALAATGSATAGRT